MGDHYALAQDRKFLLPTGKEREQPLAASVVQLLHESQPVVDLLLEGSLRFKESLNLYPSGEPRLDSPVAARTLSEGRPLHARLAARKLRPPSRLADRARSWRRTPLRSRFRLARAASRKA